MTEHRGKAHRTVRCAVITLSDTRTEETDTSGKRIRELLAEQGQPVVSYQILKDEPEQITAVVRALLAQPEVDAIITNGGPVLRRAIRRSRRSKACSKKKLPALARCSVC